MTGISNGDSLVGIIVSSEKDAFKLYNDHAFRMGFSIRKENQKFRIGCNTKYMKQFYCYKRRKKCDKRKEEKAYTEVDVRTCYKEMIEFRFNDEVRWTVIKYEDTVTVPEFEFYWRRHTVVYNENTLSISYTCKMLSEVGILYSHCLRVFNILCAESILDKYILKRWTKYVDVSGSSSGIGDARKENEGRSSGIKDPIGRRAKGVHKVRKEGIAEIKYNQARGKRKSTLMRASRVKTNVQLSMTNEDLGKDFEYSNNLKRIWAHLHTCAKVSSSYGTSASSSWNFFIQVYNCDNQGGYNELINKVEYGSK
ncbi:hypothetical protein M9H77_25727 [Catharanthus roseus]|uniref:Uncharacterized protein n=1 Tax=Catharanthus roseus TaxID=4058 RepID=A0ACC0A7Z0_CATRO|nr:hypothetical protein M9H77_25727 [Catharanthus roseus]